MYIRADKNEINNTINSVMGAVALRGTNAALECIMICTFDGEVELTSYDNSKGIKARCPAVIVEDGVILVKGDRLSTIIKNMPGGEINISTDDRNTVFICAGRAKFEIAGLPAESFPMLPVLESNRGFTLPQSLLKKQLSQVSFSYALTDIKPVLTGILFEVDGKEMKLCSCDGYRVSLCKTAVNVPDDTHLRFIVPGKTLTELYKLMKDSDDEIKIDICLKHIAFYFGGMLLFSRMIDGEYINYDATFQKTATTFVNVDLSELAQSVDRSSLVLDEKVKKGISIEFSGDSVKIYCETVNGKIYEEIPADIEGDDVVLAMNQKYVSEALHGAITAGEEKILIRVRSKINGVMFLPEDNDSFTYMILPLRT